tara:strand:+ start:306 stop:1055 length:750 start_codon:yes stop_codon:yes gene_type:complete
LQKAYFFNKEVGLFKIEDGSKIELSLSKKISNEEIVKSFLFTPMALILYQRKNLVLHASASVIGSKAFLFSGISGKGKSTILLELMKRGHKMLSEDVTAINFLKKPAIIPSFPLIKIETKSSNTKEISGIIRNIEEDYRSRQLYSVKNDLYEKKPKNIESCFFLNKVGEQAEIRKINNSMDKFTTIYKNIWRQVPANSSIDSQKQIMKNLSILINEIDFFEVNLSYNVDISINEIISNISKKIGRDGRI